MNLLDEVDKIKKEGYSEANAEPEGIGPIQNMWKEKES